MSGIDRHPYCVCLGPVRPIMGAVAGNLPWTLVKYNKVPQPLHWSLPPYTNHLTDADRRTAMRQTMLPPEMLPRSTDGKAEVVVCRNPRHCTEQHNGGC